MAGTEIKKLLEDGAIQTVHEPTEGIIIPGCFVAKPGGKVIRLVNKYVPLRCPCQPFLHNNSKKQLLLKLWSKMFQYKKNRVAHLLTCLPTPKKKQHLLVKLCCTQFPSGKCLSRQSSNNRSFQLLAPERTVLALGLDPASENTVLPKQKGVVYWWHHLSRGGVHSWRKHPVQ